MYILIAPDSYKETIDALQVSKSIKKSFKTIFPKAKIKTMPLCDGGEGTTTTLVDAKKGKLVYVNVKDPLNRKIKAFYGLINNNKTAVIEMASSSGLELLKENEKNPLHTTTYGFGQLINDALNKGVKHFILGLGGSATNDAGVGMLQALGVKFYDKNKNKISLGAKEIKKIVDFDDSILIEKLKGVKIEVACDVKNPLTGKHGASYTFGKQKGANEEMIKYLDKSLSKFAKLCEKKLKKKTKNLKGSGAAGGLGFALVTFCDAKLKSGIDLIIEETCLEKYVKKADLIITGEGKMDKQTLNGKTALGVSKLALKHKKKIIAINGCLDKGYEVLLKKHFHFIFDTTPISSDFDSIKKNAKKNLELTSLNVAKAIKMSI